jgi:nicotinic acid mononucleotide adenylyltransferase
LKQNEIRRSSEPTRIVDSDLKNLIESIHAAPPRVVIEFAGAGVQALAWLHSVGGSSRTILEATDRYAAGAVVDAVGFEPEQFTSAAVARALASRAYIRACELETGLTPVGGLGLTATIATDRQKRGDHRCWLAVCDAQGITTYALSLTKGARTRLEEEQLVSWLVLRAIARFCGLRDLPRLDLGDQERLVEETEPVDLLERLVAQEFDLVTVWPDGRQIPRLTMPRVALLSGAFNPFHRGHQQLAGVAANILGQPVFFELPLVNADKGFVDVKEARRRVAQFAGAAPLILTTVPLFSQKAGLFPHSTFVTGVDTVRRLTQPRFYHDDPQEMLASFRDIRIAGCRFLVAGRLDGDGYYQLQDITLPAGYSELFEEIPEADFRMDISSTALRARAEKPSEGLA